MGSFPVGGVRPNRGGRNVAIGVVIAVVVLGIAMCGGMAAIFSIRTPGPSSGASQVISVNAPVQGDVTTFTSSRTYEFTLTQGGAVSISVQGDFDNYLELSRAGELSPFLTDDDSGGSLNAAINTTLAPGTYRVLVRAFSSGTTGSFTLTVFAPAESSAPVNPGAGPAQPLGPQQPSFGGNVGPSVPPPQLGPAIAPQSFRGIASSVTGQPPVSAGAQCEVSITGEQAANGLSCRVQVTCGGTVIYGGDRDGDRYGYVMCLPSVRDGRQAVEAHDLNPTAQGGDPMLDLDTGAGQVTVSDRTSTGQWSVAIQLGGPQSAI